MKQTLTIIAILFTLSVFSQKAYKGTISVSPDIFSSNKYYTQKQYFGGTVEFLGNIKNTTLENMTRITFTIPVVLPTI